MPDNTNTKQPKRRWLLKTLLLILGAFVVLIIATYFIVTSSAFLKRFVLPKVGAALNAQVTADAISLQPFSSVALRRFTVNTGGVDPVLTAEEAVVRYDLFTILGGKLELDEITLQSPVIQVRQNPDGSSNLDPLLKEEPDKPSQPSEPTQIAIRNLTVKNGVVRLIATDKDQAAQITELSGLNVNVSRVQNGQPGKLDLTSSLQIENKFPITSGATNSLAQGTLTGAFEFALDQELLPERLQGRAMLEITRGTASYSDLVGLTTAIEADLTPTRINQAALRFERGGQRLGQFVASGPVDLNKSEAKLDVAVQSIDRQVLNLIGAAQGWDFRDSKFNATNHVEISSAGSRIAATGRVTGTDISIQQKQQTTPALNVELDYKTTIDFTQQTVLVEKLDLTGRQATRDLVRASLDRPMSLAWGTVGAGLPDATLKLALNQLDLEQWRPILGTNLPTGQLDLQLTFRTGLQGKQLGTDLVAKIINLSAQVGTNTVQNADLILSASGELTELKHLNLSKFELELLKRAAAQNSQPLTLAKANGSVRGDIHTLQLTVQTDADIVLPNLLAQFPIEGLSASQGSLKINARVEQQPNSQTIQGTAALANFNGQFDDYKLQNFHSTLQYELQNSPRQLRIQRLHAALQPANQPAGTLELTGTVNLTNSAAQIAFSATNLNQHALGPFLAPSLGAKKLVSISVSGQGNAGYDPSGESAMKAEAKVANLVIADSSQARPPEPLAAELKLDGAMRRQTLDLRQLQLSLSPTPRAKNQLIAQGHLDFATNNPAPSTLTVKAESLDLTPYYNVLAGSTAPATNTAPKPNTRTPAHASAPAPDTEPEPIQLPLQQVTADLQFGQVYLRELVIANFQASAKVNRGEITLKPFQLALNGAPVNLSGVVNVSVPGYQYDIALQGDQIPLEPVINSFTTQSAGAYKGNLILRGQLKGAGTTGANLQRNLAGQLDLSLTNLNLEIVGPKVKRLLAPIALALRLPELTQTPINWVNASSQIGQGRVQLNQFAVLSQAFYAEGKGDMQIAPVLTNSPLNIPVTIALRRSLAEKARVIPPNTPANTDYVSLPSFASLRGTLGDPKTDINEKAIAGILLQTAANMPQVGGDAGKILQGLGGILSGQRPQIGPTNAPPTAPGTANTNATQKPNTNQPPRINPLDLLRNLPLKK